MGFYGKPWDDLRVKPALAAALPPKCFICLSGKYAEP